MAKKLAKLEDLSFDNRNVNQGSEYGSGLLTKSLQELGAGRSVLADKNGVLIAGNKTVEKAGELGMKIKVVQTKGDELIVVQRTDLDINTEKGIKMKVLDNTVSRHNYVEDAEIAAAICEEISVSAASLGLREPKGPVDPTSVDQNPQWLLLLEFPNEQECEQMYNELQEKGLKVKIVT